MYNVHVSYCILKVTRFIAGASSTDSPFIYKWDITEHFGTSLLFNGPIHALMILL